MEVIIKPKREENVKKVFKNLKGEIIKKFSVKEGVDQYFHLITDKTNLKFGANDLGVWIESHKKIKKNQ